MNVFGIPFVFLHMRDAEFVTFLPTSSENTACRKPTYALARNNVNICQEASIFSKYTLYTSAFSLTSLLTLLLSSVALTIPYLVVVVRVFPPRLRSNGSFGLDPIRTDCALQWNGTSRTILEAMSANIVFGR